MAVCLCKIMYQKLYEFWLRELECLILEILIGLGEENSPASKAVLSYRHLINCLKRIQNILAIRTKTLLKMDMMSLRVKIPTRISNTSQKCSYFCSFY